MFGLHWSSRLSWNCVQIAVTTPSATTELAKERTRAAAERTLTSWIQNCLMLIAFGLAFDRITDAWNRAFPGNIPALYVHSAPYLALVAIGLGLFLLFLATLDYLTQTNRLHLARYFKPAVFSAFAVGGTILFAVIALVAVLIRGK
jgi:putative membrane protein